jgi:hypothetical protein
LNIGIRSPPDDGCKSLLRLVGHGVVVAHQPHGAASSWFPATVNLRKRLAPI